MVYDHLILLHAVIHVRMCVNMAVMCTNKHSIKKLSDHTIGVWLSAKVRGSSFCLELTLHFFLYTSDDSRDH